MELSNKGDLAIALVFGQLMPFIMFAVVFIGPAVVAPVISPILLPDVPCLVLRRIYLIVPPVLDKIDRPVTGIVLAAMLAPFFLVPGRHVHVNRLVDNMDRRGMDRDRPDVHDFRAGEIAHIETPVKTRLADADGNPDIRCLGCTGSRQQDCDYQQ